MCRIERHLIFIILLSIFKFCLFKFILNFKNANHFEIIFSIFKEDRISSEGFLFVRNKNKNVSYTVKYENIPNFHLRYLCYDYQFLSLHAYSYPRKLKEKQTYVLASFDTNNVYLSVLFQKARFFFFSTRFFIRVILERKRKKITKHTLA